MPEFFSRFFLGSLFLAVLLAGCTADDEEEGCAFVPPAGEKVSFVLEPYQDSLMAIRSKRELVGLLTRQPLMRDYIFRRSLYPNDSVFINEVYKRLTNPHLDTLATETKRVFGDLAELKSQFAEAFTNLKYYYPDFTPPKVQTMISGLMDNDLFVSDSLIIVSLDFFLGAKAKYRPRVYDYLLRQYNKENIVPSCMLIYGIDSRYNKTNLQDKTVLADMIAYGKSFYFAKHMLPCVPDSTFIWYTPQEISGSKKNQDLIWARLVQDQVLYSTSHMVKQKYLGERPKTQEVGPECPGRIAQFIGWQIVKAYAEENPEVNLPQLMSLPNAQALFKESHYKPERR